MGYPTSETIVNFISEKFNYMGLPYKHNFFTCRLAYTTIQIFFNEKWIPAFRLQHSGYKINISALSAFGLQLIHSFFDVPKIDIDSLNQDIERMKFIYAYSYGEPLEFKRVEKYDDILNITSLDDNYSWARYKFICHPESENERAAHFCDIEFTFQYCLINKEFSINKYYSFDPRLKNMRSNFKGNKSDFIEVSKWYFDKNICPLLGKNVNELILSDSWVLAILKI